MATADEYAEWIVKNKEKKGSPEFDTVVKAYQEAVAEEKPKEAAPEESAGTQAGKEFLRGLGLTARAGVNAVTSLPTMFADAVSAMIPMPPEVRAKYFQPISPKVDKALTSAGVPEPANAGERIVQDVSSAMGGTGALAKAASKASVPLAKFFGDQLATQIASAGLGSGAASITREAEGGPTAQMAAALLGSMSPAIAKTAASTLMPNITQAQRQNTKGMLLNKAAGDRKDAVLDALDDATFWTRGKTQFLANERPTAAQAASKANAPAFAGLEKLAVNKYNPNLAAARNANMGARLDAVRSVGKDDAALATAIADRNTASAPLYQQAEQGVLPVGPAFNNLLSRPQFKAAVGRAQELAKNAGLNDLFFRNNQGKPTALIGNGVHFIKKALDEAGEFGSKSYTGKQDAASALKTRDEFLKLVDTAIPEYAKAKAIYASKSPPVEQMRFGQMLEDKLVSPLSDEMQRPGVFAQALKEPPASMTEYGNPLTPQQAGLFGNVRASLEREALTNRQASAGTARARDIAGNELGAVDLPNWLSRSVTLARYALEHVGVKTMHKTLEELAKDLQDPGTAAKLMREATPTQLKAIQKVIQSTKQPTAAGLFQVMPQLETQ